MEKRADWRRCQGLEGMQEKYGELRVADTGIREATILGQGIGIMRGLRPIENPIPRLFLYCFQGLSDDLPLTLSNQRQQSPLKRTRGHRLEGIWHSGSPMGMILNGLRGMHVLVPRNMTKAAGFYNTLMSSDEPALVIECLNGYRLKEKMPQNLAEIKTPIGIPEVTKEGKDITIVTYGSTWRIVNEAAQELAKIDIQAEVIDIQSLLPFDTGHVIVESLKKTNRVLFVDEDVPGGATALLQKVMEEQKVFFLDSEHDLNCKSTSASLWRRCDIFQNNADDIVEKVYAIMQEANPENIMLSR